MNTENKKLTPPAFLTGYALEVWHATQPEIEAAGIAVQVESHALGAYCLAVADMAAAQAAIDQHGLIFKTERGMTKNPATAVKNAAMQHVLAFSREFGITPASRTRTLFSRRENLRPKP
jgi:P27 family predicted phage terminase small subunit